VECQHWAPLSDSTAATCCCTVTCCRMDTSKESEWLYDGDPAGNWANSLHELLRRKMDAAMPAKTKTQASQEPLLSAPGPLRTRYQLQQDSMQQEALVRANPAMQTPATHGCTCTAQQGAFGGVVQQSVCVQQLGLRFEAGC
jgi:hypothetical protein